MVTSYISKNGYTVSKSELSKNQIDSIYKELTVTPFQNPNVPGQPKSFNVYKESQSKLYLPRYYGIKNFGTPEQWKLPIVDPMDTDKMDFAGTLRPEQVKIVDLFMEKQSGIICLGCGGGKTVISLSIVSKLKYKTLIVCHKDFLINQWKERISQFLPNVRVGTIKRSIIDIESKEIVIASLQSLALKEYEPNIFNDFGIVIYDECHHLGAEVFSRAMSKTYCRITIGLSATLKRNDGLSKIIEWYLGDVVYQSNIDKKKNEKQCTQVMIYKYEDDNNEDKIHLDWRGKPIIARMINDICDDTKRNNLIIDIILKTFQKESDRQMIILSSRRSHLTMIKELLGRQEFFDVGFYVGGMKDLDLKKSESNKIILATYTMAAEALDIPSLNTLILASPVSSIEQAVGRIQRGEYADKSIKPLVIDILDEYSVFIGQSKKRLKFFKTSKFQITNIGF